MSKEVQRFVMRVKPAPDHATNYGWQVGTVCIFVGEDDRVAAQAFAEAEIAQRSFELLEYVDRSTLIPSRVEQEGGEIFEAFQRALQGSPHFMFVPDGPQIAQKGEFPPMVPPRLDESFVDRVVERAGGRRLTAEERDFDQSPNADYLLNGFVLELKDLQSDPIDVPSRQRRIAEATDHSSQAGGMPTVLDGLSDPDYLDIVLRKLKKRLDSAKTQIRATEERIDGLIRGGGAVFLNTGFTSVDPDLVYARLERLVAKSTSVDFVAMMTGQVATNGFDTWVVYPFHPIEGGPSPVEALRAAFFAETEALMDEWAADGFRVPDNPAEAMTPRSFEVSGNRYTLFNQLPPSSMGENS